MDELSIHLDTQGTARQQEIKILKQNEQNSCDEPIGASSSQRTSSNAIVANQPQTSKPQVKGN